MTSDTPLGNTGCKAFDVLMLTVVGYQLFSQGGAQSEIFKVNAPELNQKDNRLLKHL